MRGDGGSSERVSLRHHDPHLALEHFRPSAAHFGTSFLSSGGCRIGLAEIVNGSEWRGSDRHIEAGSAGELKCRIVTSDRRTDVVNLYIRFNLCKLSYIVPPYLLWFVLPIIISLMILLMSFKASEKTQYMQYVIVASLRSKYNIW